MGSPIGKLGVHTPAPSVGNDRLRTRRAAANIQHVDASGKLAVDLLCPADAAPSREAGPPERCIEGFLQGDAAAFEELFRRVAPRLLRVLRLQTRDAQLADDLLQTTFLKVVRAAGTYQRGMSVEAWIWAIARHTLRDDRRRRERRGEELVAEPDSPPAQDAQGPGMREAIARALAQLPEAQREAVLLLKVQELSVREAAAAAGTTVGGIKMRAQRAYQVLRRLLDPGSAQ
jgi:RNA polymerase sigma-70 factor (ECF subfamily)